MANGLYQAVVECRHQQVRWLLDSGLSVHSTNSRGQSLLVGALHIQHPKRRQHMFRYLVKRGARTDFRDRSTGRDLLCWACYLDALEQAIFLLDEQQGELNLAELDQTGFSPLHYATMRGNAELVGALCAYCQKYAINVDIGDRDGYTPYMYAKRMGRQDLAKMLLQSLASRRRCDDKFFRDGTLWQAVGDEERKEEQYMNRGRKIGAYKALGRLPQLRAANFQTEDVRMVQSKLDRQILNKVHHASTEDLTFSHYSDDKSKRHQRCRSKSLPPPRPSYVYPEEHRFYRRKNSQDDAFLLLKMTKLGHDQYERTRFRASQVDPSKYRDYHHLLPTLMTQLADQYTEAYRPRAKDVTSQRGHGTRGKKASSLAAIRGRRRNLASVMLHRRLNKTGTKSSLHTTFNPLLDKPETSRRENVPSRADTNSP